MAGIRNKEILRLLKDGIKDSLIKQADIAKELGIKPPFLSRQLSGRDPISLERCQAISRMLKNPILNEKLVVLFEEEINSTPDADKGDLVKLGMIQKIETIGKDSFLSFILDFWADLDEKEKGDVLRLVLNIIESKQKKGGS